MSPTSMHENRGNKSEPDRRRRWLQSWQRVFLPGDNIFELLRCRHDIFTSKDFSRYRGISESETDIRTHTLVVEKDDDICQDQQVINERCAVPVCIIITYRYHRARLSFDFRCT